MSEPPAAVPPSRRAWPALVFWLLLTAAAGAVGSAPTAIAPWFYRALDRPGWAPPPEVFGVVWPALYVMMGTAAWLLWRERTTAMARWGVGLYLLQLALNGLWPWLFFAWRMGALALADALALTALLAVLVRIAWQVRRPAGVLLIPCLAWAAYAALLTLALWRRNPEAL